jgi:hypothetical protein
VVISASHNTFEDNGIKFFSAKGTKLPYVWEVAVEQMLLDEPHWVPAIALGKTQVLDDAAGRYIEFCKSTCDHAFTLRGLKIVVDAGHGAAYQIAPMVLHELGAEVVAIGCAPDGMNINQGAGAAHPSSWPRPFPVAVRISASPWMAMPIACWSSMRPGGSTTGTSCCTWSSPTAWSMTRALRAPSAR